MNVTEKAIIPIFQDRAIDGELAHEQYVNARDVWAWLEVGKDFTTWMKDRIEKYEYQEGIDFSPELGRSAAGRQKSEYFLTMDAAVEIASGENSKNGRFLRRYLWEVVKRNNELEKMRLKAKCERRVLTDIIKELVPESPHKSWVYKHYTDLVYKIVTGFNAKEIREIKGLDKDANVRPFLSEDELWKVIKLERVIQGLLSVGMDYEGIKSALFSLSASQQAQIQGKI